MLKWRQSCPVVLCSFMFCHVFIPFQPCGRSNKAWVVSPLSPEFRPFPRVWHTSVHGTENPQFPRISHISSITNSRRCLTADWERDPTVVATQSYHPALLTLGYRAFLQPQKSRTTTWVVPIFQYHPPSPDNTVAGSWGGTHYLTPPWLHDFTFRWPLQAAL